MTLVTWKPGDVCPNCHKHTMELVPRPPAELVKAAARPDALTRIPQTFDTAPADTIDELGDLYRCDPCDSKVRVKATPAGAGTGA